MKESIKKRSLVKYKTEKKNERGNERKRRESMNKRKK